MSYAIVFPGQGSQAVGMLAALAARYPAVGETFAAASAVLGYDLWALVQGGPAEALNTTTRTQPALLAADVAVWRVWCAAGGPRPAVLAGHSLGEYAALVAAGALAFETALELVALRAEAMQAAVPAGEGAMAAILGLDAEEVRQVCEEAGRGDVVEAANFNAPGQVVIAGRSAAVARALDNAKAHGAKRAIPLAVSVPSHCRLMQSAADKLALRLATVAFEAPEIPVIHNVDVAEHRLADDIRHALALQLYRPVRWSDTVECMVRQGVTHLVEAGPGKVLTGLAKRIDRRLAAMPANDPENLAAALAAAREYA
jgi:[acyl-carrier-protein] S-malonyltransferase